MKKFNMYKGYTLILAIAILFASCEENPVGPSYKKIGSATATNAFISLSTTQPVSGTSMTITMRYVNISSDPAEEMVLLVQEGTSGNFTELETFNEVGQEQKTEHTRTHTYNVVQIPGTQLTFRLELRTQKEFPKLVNSPTVTVQLPAPQLDDPFDVTSSGFTVSWSEVEHADGYRLDIATDEAFNNKVSGYNQKEIAVPTLTEVVTGLSPATTYYVRVYAAKGTLQSQASATKSVVTGS